MCFNEMGIGNKSETRQKRVFVYSTHIGKSHRVSNFIAIDNANMEMEKRKRRSTGLVTDAKVL